MLAGVKEKTKIELYVAVVETTGATDISAFSQKLANDWRIGAKNSPRKTLLLVISADSKSSFTQFSRAVMQSNNIDRLLSPRQIDNGKRMALTHNLGGAPGECVSFVSIVGSEPSA